MATATQVDVTILEVIVIGLGGSGKTTLMRSISQKNEWSDPQQRGWHSGRLMVDDTLMLNFLEPPANRSFDFLWMRELIGSVDVPGYIVVFDATAPEYFGEAISILQTIRAYHEETPCVVAVNKQDHPDAWSANDVRIGLGIPNDIPVLPCIAHRPDSVREVVLQLLYRIFDTYQ